MANRRIATLPSMNLALIPALLSTTALLGLALPAAAAQPPQPETRVVILHRPGPAWNPALPFMQQPGLQHHIDYYRAWLKAGKLSLGGPFLDGAGGIMISRPGASIEEVKRFAEQDPAVKSGLLRVEVHPWMVAFRDSPDGVTQAK